MKKIVLEKLHGGQVWKVTLNAPKGNVVDSAMLGELHGVVDQLGGDKHCKLLLLQGAGRHFSFGVSVEEHRPEGAAAMLDRFNGLFLRLAEVGVPVCAAVSGQCLGGGMELATFAHFVFADESARLGQPEINLGVFPIPALVIVPMKAGQSVADDLILSGRSLDAHEAKQLDLVSAVYADRASMEEGIEAWIQRTILPKSALALRVTAQAVRREFDRLLRCELASYRDVYMDVLMQSHDGREGLNAFLEKRSPVWTDE